MFFISEPDVFNPPPQTGYPGFQTATYTSRSYAGITPGYTYQFPGNHSTLPVYDTASHELTDEHTDVEQVSALTSSSKSKPRCCHIVSVTSFGARVWPIRSKAQLSIMMLQTLMMMLVSELCDKLTADTLSQIQTCFHRNSSTCK